MGDSGPWDGTRAPRFGALLVALAILLIGYPYFGDTPTGTFMGGVASLVVLTGAVWALRARRWPWRVGVALMLVTVGASAVAFLGGHRGHPVVEASFSAFYAFTTVAVFLDVIRSERVTPDTLYGAVCVYLLIGLTFGSLFDTVETITPGSFQINVSTEGPPEIRWRTLIFLSFMTLTTVGFGDVTPTTPQTQSLVSIEGVIGVLYVAVLIARIVGISARGRGDDGGRA